MRAGVQESLAAGSWQLATLVTGASGVSGVSVGVLWFPTRLRGLDDWTLQGF